MIWTSLHQMIQKQNNNFNKHLQSVSKTRSILIHALKQDTEDYFILLTPKMSNQFVLKLMEMDGNQKHNLTNILELRYLKNKPSMLLMLNV